jgi:hypothetical protein
MARQPGQRRDEILQALATLLESPDSGKITTAALAARLHCIFLFIFIFIFIFTLTRNEW